MLTIPPTEPDRASLDGLPGTGHVQVWRHWIRKDDGARPGRMEGHGKIRIDGPPRWFGRLRHTRRLRRFVDRVIAKGNAPATFRGVVIDGAERYRADVPVYVQSVQARFDLGCDVEVVTCGKPRPLLRRVRGIHPLEAFE